MRQWLNEWNPYLMNTRLKTDKRVYMKDRRGPGEWTVRTPSNERRLRVFLETGSSTNF